MAECGLIGSHWYFFFYLYPFNIFSGSVAIFFVFFHRFILHFFANFFTAIGFFAFFICFFWTFLSHRVYICSFFFVIFLWYYFFGGFSVYFIRYLNSMESLSTFHIGGVLKGEREKGRSSWNSFFARSHLENSKRTELYIFGILRRGGWRSLTL